MSTIKDITALGSLVAATHGWAEAKRFKAWQPGDADKAVLATRARELLDIFPDVAGAGARMSAAFAVHLERALDAPIHVVAGTLLADGERVFGSDAPIDGAALFSDGGPDFDGHMWVMIGGYVADIALFRTAYSRLAPPALGRHVAATFGPGKALYFDAWRHTRQVGLRYEPRHVLTRDQVDGLVRGAHRLIEEHRAAR